MMNIFSKRIAALLTFMLPVTVSAQLSLPYHDSFDSPPSLWASDTAQMGSDWELGIPNVGVTSGSYSFPDCWDVDLHNRPVSNTHAYLYSPLFNFTGTHNKLSFRRNHYVQDGRDGFRLEYCLFQNGIWSVLGDTGDVRGTNWYDTTIAGGSLQPGWSGNTAGTWILSSYLLTQFAGITGIVQFRFVFDSDISGTWMVCRLMISA
jgi:hypothetical protein